MNRVLYIVFLVAFIASSIPAVSAELTMDTSKLIKCGDGSYATTADRCPVETRDFDTIDNAPEEKERGTINADSDGDGLSDGTESTAPLHEPETKQQTSPLYEGAIDPDDDGDGVPTTLDADSDADGLSDGYGDVDGDGYGDVANTRDSDGWGYGPGDIINASYCDNPPCEDPTTAVDSSTNADSISKRSARTGINEDLDCNDSDCPVRLEADVNGEIILGEDRDMVMPSSCPDDKCIVELAERCGDDVCVASVAEHCKDDKCIVELAQVCGDESCVAALTQHCKDDVCVEEIQDSVFDGAADQRAARTGLASDDCDDTDCDVRPSAAKKGYDAYQAQSDMNAGINPNEMGEDEQEGIGLYLQNKSNLSGSDFGLAVAYAASGNEQVRNVRYNNETDEVEVDHVEQVRLFGFIPMRANAKSSIRVDGEVRTHLPWWSFAATKSSNSTAWMSPEQISTDALKKGDRISTERSPQTSGEEVDILGMGVEKLAQDTTDFKTGAELSKAVN